MHILKYQDKNYILYDNIVCKMWNSLSIVNLYQEIG